MPEHVPVAEAKNITIYCPYNGRYSFFNSPYPAHKAKSGIDLYPSLKFGDIAGCPVEGEVIYYRKIKAPEGKGFVDSGFDAVILLRPVENPEVVVKVLHLDPCVEIGDKLRIGDGLGVLLRSGYYGWGTSPHVHLEVRPKDDPIRSRGGFQLKNLHFSKLGYEENLVGTVVHVQAEYALMEMRGAGTGLVGYVNGEEGLLDGGIPYYGWLGIHKPKPQLGEIMLNGKSIADIHTLFSGAGIASCRKFSFTIKTKNILGLSLYLSPDEKALIKAIPLKAGELNVEVGEEVKVNLV